MGRDGPLGCAGLAIPALIFNPGPCHPRRGGAQLFKVLADPVRLAIIHELSQGGRSVGDLVRNLDMGQTRISNHPACLRHCQLVRGRQESRHGAYSLLQHEIVDLLGWAERLIAARARELMSCLVLAAEPGGKP